MKDERQEGRADGMEEGRKIPKPDTMAMDAQLGEADTWADKLRTLVRQNKMAAVSAVVIVLMILVAVFAPWVAPYDHLAQSLTERLQDPSAAHWLGTDEEGRDILARLLYGIRLSFVFCLSFDIAFFAYRRLRSGQCRGILAVRWNLSTEDILTAWTWLPWFMQ